MIFERTVAIARLTPNSDNANKEQYVAVGNLNNVKINIQPATAELTAVTEGAYGQTFRAFVTVSGLKIGDRVTVSGTTDQYIVKGIQDWNYGFIPHYELVLFRGDA